MSVYAFVVPGPPTPKGRPRFGRTKTGRVVTRTPKATRIYESIVRAHALATSPPNPLDGPVRVTIAAVLERPKRLMRKKDPDEELAHDRRPDVDNIAKAILDALDGWFWRDDAQVAELHCSKVYAAKDGRPMVAVTVETMQ